MTAKPPVHVVSIALTPKIVGDEALALALVQLKAEDPTIRITSADPTTGRVVVAGVSELHLEIIIDRLRREFSIVADVDRPVAFLRGSLREMAIGDWKHTNAKPGRHEYAHVRVRVTPRDDGAGYVFENGLAGNVLPDRFIAATEQGIDNARMHSVFSGHPVEDVKVELIDGSYHDTHSSESAFRIAAGQAFIEGVMKAKPIVVEPVMRVEVSVPEEFLRHVTAGLVERRGQIQFCEERGGEWRTVVALVPVAQLFGYATQLRQLSYGRATYAMRFVRYQPRPEGPNPGDGDRASMVGAPRKPVVPGRLDAIALPEPDEGDNSDDDWLQPRS